jgi:hypothetical protein
MSDTSSDTENEPMEVEKVAPKKMEVLNNNLPWVEKYRPNTLSDLISQQHITSTSNSKKKVLSILIT